MMSRYGAQAKLGAAIERGIAVGVNVYWTGAEADVPAGAGGVVERIDWLDKKPIHVRFPERTRLWRTTLDVLETDAERTQRAQRGEAATAALTAEEAALLTKQQVERAVVSIMTGVFEALPSICVQSHAFAWGALSAEVFRLSAPLSLATIGCAGVAYAGQYSALRAQQERLVRLGCAVADTAASNRVG